MKRMMIAALVLMLAMMSMGASAQVDCPAGIEGADCDLYTQAIANAGASETASFTFSQSTVFDMMIMAIDQSASGAGQLVLDGAGNIVAASVELPEVTNNMGGMFGSGDGATTSALSFVYVDGVMYFGTGDSLDSLTWESFTPDEFDLDTMDLTLAGMIGTVDSSGMGIDPVSFGVTYSREDGVTLEDGTSVTAFSYDISEVSLSELMEEAINSAGDLGGDMAGLGLMGIDGTLTGTSSMYVDPNQPIFLGMSADIDITLDMSGMMGDETEGVEGMDSLFGDMSGNVTMDMFFTDFNSSVEIVAPEGATEMDGVRADGIRYTSGLLNIIVTYSTNMATEASFSGDFGFDTGGYYYYSSNCTADTRTLVSGGSLSVGDSISGSLSAGEAAEWTFSGAAGDLVTISLSSPDEEIDPYLELLGPDGLGLASDDDGMGYPNSQISGYELPSDGTYTIVACTYWDDDAGVYELSLSN